MANRRGHSGRSNKLDPEQTDELSRLSVQYFLQWPARLHLRNSAADRGHLSLFPQLRRVPARPEDLCARDVIDVDGSVHPILYYLFAGDDGVLDFGNHHHRFHCLLIRIFPRRPNVSDRHHAGGNPGGAEMDAILLRTVLPGRDLPGALERRGTLASARHSNGLALSHLGNRAYHVAPRPRPLSSRRRLNHFVVGKPAVFQALKPPAMERTFL